MIKTFFLVLTLIIAVSSCQKSKVVILSGEIENYNNQPLLIADYKVSNEPDTIELIDGKFTTTLQIENPSFKYLMFENLRKEVFLIPGTSLKISFNTTNIDSSFRYLGEGSVENTILDSISVAMKKFDYRLVYTQSKEIALSYIDSTNKSYKQYFQKLSEIQKVKPIFKEFEEASLDYNCAALKTIIGLKNEIKDTNYFSFFHQLNIENEKYLDIPSYRMFLEYFISENARKIIDKESNSNSESLDMRFDADLLTIEKLKNAKIKEYLIFNTLDKRLEYNGVKGFEKYREYFNKTITDSVYTKNIEKKYLKKLPLAPGMPAPEFACSDVNDKYFSLKDFRGKYLYIDFWATWCTPCMQEMPAYKKLQSDYNLKQITFLSISFDRDKNTWKSYVNSNNHQAVNLFTENGWNSDIAKAYQISGIPTFVLIDKEGNFIDSQAPRPSSVEIRKILNELFAKN